MEMIAKRRVKYPSGHAGREYAPGQPFTALSERDAKALYVSGRADYAGGDRAAKPRKNLTDLPASSSPTLSQPEDETAQLRDQYAALLGKRPFNGWDADELRKRMVEYQRTDMRAAPSGEYQTTAMEAED